MIDLCLKQGARAWPRVRIPATARVIKHHADLGLFQIDNLSAGGALLIDCPDIATGSELTLILKLPSYPEITLDARVVRKETNPQHKTSIAVTFHSIDHNTEDLIHDIVLCYLADQHQQQLPAVLVVDDCEGMRNAIKRDLKKLNRPVVLAPMPLDAIRLLLDKNITIDTAIIDLNLGPENGMMLLKYLKNNYPSIKRILISDQDSQTQLQLAKSAGSADLVLTKPWTQENIIEVFAA